jgi:hypothetical protein
MIDMWRMQKKTLHDVVSDTLIKLGVRMGLDPLTTTKKYTEAFNNMYVS